MKSSPKKTMVFLPGWGFKATIWEDMLDVFKQYTILLLDLPIITQTTLSTSNQLPDIIQQLHEKIPKNAIIVAWSLSGLLAIQLCRQYPRDYRQLILVNSTPKFLAANQWPGIPIKLKNKFIKHMQTDFDYLVEIFINTILYPQQDNINKEFLLKHFSCPYSLAMHGFYLDLLFALDLRDVYEQISIPIAHIVGAKDTIIPNEFIIPLSQLNLHTKIHIIPEAGHIPFLTHKNYFIHKIQEIIDGPYSA